MNKLTDIPPCNQRFVESGEYEKHFTDEYLGRELAILSCMDVCITELLLDVLGLENDDIKLIKNAGVLVTHPWGSVIRSLLVAVFELKVKEIMVVIHRGYGMRGLHVEEFFQRAHNSNVPDDRIKILRNTGISLDGWLTGFDDVEDSIRHTVGLIRKRPLIPNNIAIHGLVIRPTIGKLDLTVNDSLPTLDDQGI